MDVDEKINLLLNYVNTLPDFKICHPEYPYNHMGATIIDAILQSGLRYDTVVEPRVKRVRASYPAAKTTSGFLNLLEKISVNDLLNWKDSEKPMRILGVGRFFKNEGLETEEHLKMWLTSESNVRNLKKIRGIKNKTADYFKILSGISTSAVDRHLTNFVNNAGIHTSSYSEIQKLINTVAEQKGIDKTIFDYSIWKYMSSKEYSKSSSCSRKSHLKTLKCINKA